jgi:hypothetical protein
MIQPLLLISHPNINISTLYTFLWCLWKTRNDALFNRKYINPIQIYPVVNAILQGFILEDNGSQQDHRHIGSVEHHLEPQMDPFSLAGNIICCDAA